MSASAPPSLPAEEHVTYRNLPQGRVRSRRLGQQRPGIPPVVVVMGMAVADYLMPGLACLAEWTEAHLVELPGFAGSGEPSRKLTVGGYAETVAAWLDAADLGQVVLAGHSSGTQTAARAARLRSATVAALVLASPTIDPKARSWTRLLMYWRLDGRYPTPGLNASHKPEWRRAGARRLIHAVHAHLHDHLADTIPQLTMPVLVLRGRDDRLLSSQWARELVKLAPHGGFAEMPGPHTFPWVAPGAWSPPIRALVNETTNSDEANVRRRH
jgi:pimeloyl-ACP methyl ester carboxylesterase